MKKGFFLTILLFLMNCTAIDIDYNKSDIVNEVNIVQNEIVSLAKINNKKKIKNIFSPTFKNNILLSFLEEYDISYINILFSNNIQVISKDRASSLMLLNYANDTTYFLIEWIKKNDEWKIYDVVEKK